MIEIDGSIGEGGGQVLRTSLSLSCLLKKPFHIYNIRKGRKRPGLMPQHLMCIRALKEISHASVSGDTRESLEFSFEPGEIKAGNYSFDIGTAGSTPLLLQSILPPLVFAHNTSTVTLKGGTHVPFSPPYHYINDIFIPLLKELGITIQTEIVRYGFYPKGGGEITARVTPSRRIKTLKLLERGNLTSIQGISGVGNLPMSIAERQRDAVLQSLDHKGLSAEIQTSSVPSHGQGTFVFLKANTENSIAGFSSLGERGKKAEVVGEEAAHQFLDYFSASACLDPHLADQIVLYLSMAEGSSSLSTSRITNHLLTNLQVLEKFLPVRHSVEGKTGSPGIIGLNPV